MFHKKFRSHIAIFIIGELFTIKNRLRIIITINCYILTFTLFFSSNKEITIFISVM